MIIFVGKIKVIGILELRKDLHEYINYTDEHFLKMVFAMRRKYEADLIVGYETDGTPITQQTLVKRIKAASLRVKSGDYIVQEDIEKEVDNW